MKKFLYLASGAALALASCSDDLGFKNNESPVIEGKSKITATYQIGDETTRTSMGVSGNSLVYKWNLGDNIGVFGLDGDVVNNAMFVYPYEAASTTGTLIGQVDIIPGNYYLGYYPYAAESPYNASDSELTMTISQVQNYNTKGVASNPGTDKLADGSFSNGAAPAVTLAQADENGELSFSFQPLASYLILPVAGELTENVTKFELTVTNQVLYGNLTVNVGEAFLANPSSVSYEIDESQKGNPIQLTVSGEGLDISEITNLWFVIPSTLQLAGNTLTLTAYNGDEKLGEVSKLYADDWTWPNLGTQEIGRNKAMRIWAGPNNTPFYLSSFEGYTIRTEAQFLEYASLVTKGLPASVEAYNSLAVKSYSDLPNMLNKSIIIDSSDGSISGAAYVKPALIANDLTFDANTISEIMQYLGIGDPNQLSKKGTYYSTVYGSYLFSDNHSIPTIGGSDNAYSIQGTMKEKDVTSQDCATISGLYIEGNGLFANSNPKWRSYVINLNIADVTVDASVVENMTEGTASTFLTIGSMGYNGVSVESSCKLIANEASVVEEEDGETVTVEGLFGDVDTTWFTPEYNKIINVTNGIENLPYAVTLNVIEAGFVFSEEKTIGLYDFTNIVLRSNGYALTVENGFDDAQYLVNNVQKGEFNYSILGDVNPETEQPSTSYWTGTKYSFSDNHSGFKYPAEIVAALVQEPTKNNGNYALDLNLNLMGTYTGVNPETGEPVENTHMRWYTGGNNYSYTSASKDNSCSISNIWIDGTNDGETYQKDVVGAYTLTLFGRNNKVNNITVNDITISPVSKNAPNGILMGAITVWAQAGSSNITVNNMTVESADVIGFDEAMGGIFWGVKGDVLSGKNAITKISIPQDVKGQNGKNAIGYLAGELQWTVTGNDGTIINPCSNVEGRTPFGKPVIQVQPQENQTSTLLYLNGFGSDYIDGENIGKYISIVGDELPSTGTYTVGISQDGVKTSWVYDYENKTFSPWK